MGMIITAINKYVLTRPQDCVKIIPNIANEWRHWNFVRPASQVEFIFGVPPAQYNAEKYPLPLMDEDVQMAECFCTEALRTSSFLKIHQEMIEVRLDKYASVMVARCPTTGSLNMWPDFLKNVISTCTVI